MFEYSCFLTLPVPVFVGCSFVVLFLALRHADAQLGATFVPVQVEWNEGHSFTVDGANQSVQLLPMQ